MQTARILSVLSVFVLPAVTALGKEPAFEPRRVVRPFPPIKDAPVKKASEVEDEVLPQELVLGVEVGGDARAYPINMLTGPSREIINDVVGGRAIAATW